MKKTQKDFERYILSVIKKYTPILLLQRHTWEISDKIEDEGSYFESVTSYPYLNAKINYSKRAFEDWKKGKNMVPFILHEFCHSITDPLYCKATSRYASKREIEDERERLTDLICNITLSKKP